MHPEDKQSTITQKVTPWESKLPGGGYESELPYISQRPARMTVPVVICTRTKFWRDKNFLLKPELSECYASAKYYSLLQNRS